MGFPQIVVMSELKPDRGFFNSWLVRINFPWVHIKEVGAFFPQDMLYTESKKRAGYQPKISPATDRYDPAAQVNVADGEFVEIV